MGTEGNTEPTTEETQAVITDSATSVIASPSRRADGTVTHAPDSVIPDPEGYAQAAADQLAGLGVDADQARTLAAAEARIETTDEAPAETTAAAPVSETTQAPAAPEIA